MNKNGIVGLILLGLASCQKPNMDYTRDKIIGDDRVSSKKEYVEFFKDSMYVVTIQSPNINVSKLYSFDEYFTVVAFSHGKLSKNSKDLPIYLLDNKDQPNAQDTMDFYVTKLLENKE